MNTTPTINVIYARVALRDGNDPNYAHVVAGSRNAIAADGHNPDEAIIIPDLRGEGDWTFQTLSDLIDTGTVARLYLYCPTSFFRRGDSAVDLVSRLRAHGGNLHLPEVPSLDNTHPQFEEIFRLLVEMARLS